MNFPTPEHVQAAQDAAAEVYAETKVYVWPSSALAQVDIESAGATRVAGRNNFGGIKATQEQIAAGEAVYLWTEEVRGGVRVKVKQWFATYATLRDFYLAHAKLLATHRVYSAAWRAPDAKAFIRAIAPHYATAPDYATVVIGVMEAKALGQWDRPPASVPPKLPSVVASPAVHSGVGAAIGGAVVLAGSQGGHLPWHLIGAAAVVAAVGVGWWLVASRGRGVAVTAANTAAPPPAPSPAKSPVAPLSQVAEIPDKPPAAAAAPSNPGAPQ